MAKVKDLTVGEFRALVKEIVEHVLEEKLQELLTIKTAIMETAQEEPSQEELTREELLEDSV